MENKLQPSRVLISILSAVGVWTFKSDWQSLYRLYGFILHLIFSYAFTLAMYINIAFITSLEDTTEALYMCLTETAMLVKISTMFINGSRISSLVAFMLDKKLTLKNQAEVDVFISNYTFFNRTRISYLTVCLLCITSGFVGPLFLEETKFPFPAWFPFDWRNSSRTYWVLYGYEVVAMTINCVTNATLDLFQAYLLFQLSMYFELIGLRLQNVGIKRTSLEGAPKVVEESSVQELIEHVKLHQDILRMATEVQEIISIPIFVQFNLSAVVICFTAFQLKTISPIEDTGTFLLHFYYIVAMVFQIFLSCFYGDLVTSRSYALTNAIYNSNWVELDVKYQKLIFIYMESMKKPIKIQAGSLFVIGLSIFTTIINNAYSLFALLLNMDK